MDVASVVTVSLFSRSVGVHQCFHEKVGVRFGVGVFLKHYVQQRLQTRYPVLHLC